jgi:hypothetical protein
MRRRVPIVDDDASLRALLALHAVPDLPVVMMSAHSHAGVMAEASVRGA